ncbi:MAG: hypothetical protein LAT84_00210 [Balneolia bacterium]|nr:hypothetical protein [Balneolia bacterium]
MKITSDFKFDKPAEKPESGSYEWWYFDAADEKNEWHVVVIFYDGCPFSTKYNTNWASESKISSAKEHPAISISLYFKGEPVFYSMSEYPPSQAEFNMISDHEIKVQVGKNILTLRRAGNQLQHTLELNETLPSGDELNGTMVFTSETVSETLFGNQSAQESGHGWNLTQPRADVSFDMALKSAVRGEKFITWKGTGYHDHNLGAEPMKNEFSDWYWGRFHFPEHTLVYYLMNTGKTTDYKAWLLNRKGELQSEFDEGSLSTFMSNMFLLTAARTINLGNKQQDKVMIQQSRILDSGPFYFRFRSDAILHLPGTDQLEQGSGITEYIRPSRIHARLFWPLVHMRYRYADSPHWVQKSPRLYRWTW